MKTPPICFWCTRRVFEDSGRNTCAAFPDGIPAAIYVDGFDHRKPFRGDRGVRFLAERGLSDAEVDDLFLMPDPGTDVVEDEPQLPHEMSLPDYREA